MSFPNHRDEPRSSRRGRRLQRRGSSASSRRRKTSASDDNRGPSRANYMEDRVEPWRGMDTPYYPRVRRVTSLPPDSQRTRALPEFEYHPLEEGEIRVLRLLAGNEREKLRCELNHMSLKRPRTFIALSYAWGDKHDKLDIELNGVCFDVTNSLYGALKAVREPDHDVLVWADAVCINQDDKEERSKQVQEMFRIYQEAHFVGIWLGPEADNSDRAISLINKFTEEGLSREELKQIIHSRSWELHFHALVDLFNRDYWDRLWVVQEVKNAKQAMVYCGDHTTNWDRFSRVSDVLATFRDDLRRRIQGVTRFKQRSRWAVLVEYGPASLRTGLGSSLNDYLNYFRPSLTSDPLDKLYGLLGILPSHMRKDFRPNYKLSPQNLYIDIVEYFLRVTSSLNFLCYAHRLYLDLSPLQVPSWVPDWSEPLPFTPLLSVCANWNGSRFCASGSVEGEVQLLGATRNRLKMEAIYIGSLQLLGASLPNMLDSHTIILGLIDWWHIFKRLSAKDNESFCRTITLGQIFGRGWTSVCCHVIGIIAKDHLPSFPSHPDLRYNPSIGIDHQEAGEIFHKELQERLGNQHFFVTENNDIGLARGNLDPGLLVCIPLGCNTPVILRLDGRDGEYVFHGDAYVDGFMYGEAIELWKRGEMELRTYTLH